MAKRRRLHIIMNNNQSSTQDVSNINEDVHHSGQHGETDQTAQQDTFVAEEDQPSGQGDRTRQPEQTQQSERETTQENTYETASSNPANSSNESTGVEKKTRGATKLVDVWGLKSGERIAVTVNKMAQPIGKEGKTLTTFLGTLVKMPNLVAINFKSWKDISPATKDNLWSIVKEKFCFLPAETEEVKKWVIADMGCKWRSWKSTLKANNYDPTLTIDEMVENETDVRVHKDQFRDLVTMWVTPKFQELSEGNKQRRHKNQEPHVTGSKSFARLAEEEAAKNNGVRPTRGQLFVKTRTRKDGTIVNETAASVVDSLKTVETDAEGSQQSGDIPDWRNDDLAKVKGPERRGRIRCLGNVATVRDKGASSSQQQHLCNQDPEGQALRAQLSRLSRNYELLLGAFKQVLPPEQLNELLSSLNSEVPDQLSPANHRSSNHRSSTGSHQPSA